MDVNQRKPVSEIICRCGHRLDTIYGMKIESIRALRTVAAANNISPEKLMEMFLPMAQMLEENSNRCAEMATRLKRYDANVLAAKAEEEASG